MSELGLSLGLRLSTVDLCMVRLACILVVTIFAAKTRLDIYFTRDGNIGNTSMSNTVTHDFSED